MSGYYGLIELLLVFAIVLGLGLWELRNLRRDARAARAKAQDDGEATRAADD